LPPPETCRALTGAWIETCLVPQRGPREPCRALTGAWIETSHRSSRWLDQESRPHGRVDRNRFSRPLPASARVAPSRARGSKQDARSLSVMTCGSRPHGRVDRNTDFRVNEREYFASRPHGRVDRNWRWWARRERWSGRALTGAWIETSVCRYATNATASVAPSRARGSKQSRHVDEVGGIGRALTGAWIETFLMIE